MSLLDDVSIVVTPNGYKAGELYAVIPTPTEGAELVVNGDFASDLTGWTPYGTTSATGGIATIGADASSGIYQTILTDGLEYTVTIDVISYDGVGTATITDNGGNILYTITSAGVKTFTFYQIAQASGTFIIKAQSNALLSISSVSVKQVISADMDVTRATAATRVDEDGLVNYAEVIGDEEVVNGDFELNSDWNNFGTPTTSEQSTEQSHTGTYSWKIIADATLEGIYSPNNFSVTSGLQYTVSLWIYSVSGTSIKSGLNNTNVSVFTVRTVTAGQWTNITYEATAHTTGASYISILSENSLNFYIDNVSVKQVDRDNVPRIDYTGGGCPHILAEPQRTNLLPYSSDFSSWTSAQSSVTLTSNAAISPEGLQNATQIVFSDNTQTQLFQYIAAVSGTVYTTSTFIKYKSGTDRNIKIGVYDSEFKVIQLNFNTDGTIASTSTSGTLVDSGYEDYGNGWYRAYIVHTGATTGNIEVQFNRVGLSNTNEQFYIYGSQLEVGSYATSYIPTNGEALGVTRNQDIFTRDGIGSLIGSEGVLFVEMAALANDGTNRGISLNDGTATNRLLLYFSAASNQIAVISTGFTGSIIYTLPDETLFNKIAVRYKANDITLWVDGESRGTPITSATIPTFTALKFDSGIGASPLFAKVKQLQVYNTALTDEQLLQLTGTSGTDFYESYAEMASALTYTIQ